MGEAWWNETVQFRKYLGLFRKAAIWDLEELLIEIRSAKDIVEKTGIANEDDVRSIWEHVECLRGRHSLYSDASEAKNNVAGPHHMNYSAPPMPVYQEASAVHAQGAD